MIMNLCIKQFPGEHTFTYTHKNISIIVGL